MSFQEGSLPRPQTPDRNVLTLLQSQFDEPVIQDVITNLEKERRSGRVLFFDEEVVRFNEQFTTYTLGVHTAVARLPIISADTSFSSFAPHIIETMKKEKLLDEYSSVPERFHTMIDEASRSLATHLLSQQFELISVKRVQEEGINAAVKDHGITAIALLRNMGILQGAMQKELDRPSRRKVLTTMARSIFRLR
jgi:hypothetical protein